MKPWCVVQHVAWEGPGSIGSEARARAIELRVARMDLGDRLPSPGELGGLVVMGGPMDVGDTSAYPHLAGERALLAAAVEAGIPTLGVCLGSQLLASALGARVFKGPSLEIGIGDVTLTADGERDPVLGGAGVIAPVVQWHHHTFDLPERCVRLASSRAYENQAFRLGDRVYGIQFHPELDSPLLRAWAPHFPEGVTIDEVAHARAASAGRALISRFFDLASRTSTG